MTTLYGYWRSTAAYRVRIVLNIKGIKFENIPVHLTREGGEQKCPWYTDINPQMLVPTLVEGDVRIGQSMAIVEYLEEVYPDPSILPGDSVQRARARQAALAIACDIHPLNNLRALGFLQKELGVDEEGKLKWYRHWILENFKALESWAAEDAVRGPYFLGDTLSIADVCIVPQLYNARRFDVPLGRYPRLVDIDRACRELDVFRNAAPENQPDAA